MSILSPGPRFVSALLALLAMLPVLSALGADAGDSHSFILPKSIQWQDAPPSLPKGAQAAVLYGDPGKAGTFVIRLKTPAGYKIPPHWHGQAENLTVISGTLYLGMGDKMQPAEAHALSAGGFHHLPANTHHYAFTKAPTIVQVQAEGPFDIHYLNEADDPQKAAKK
jgi:quercetin dioxygenase-like cupin family protein